jgi:hypothetical protein
MSSCDLWGRSKTGPRDVRVQLIELPCSAPAFDRILTSNPINKISNVWSGFCWKWLYKQIQHAARQLILEFNQLYRYWNSYLTRMYTQISGFSRKPLENHVWLPLWPITACLKKHEDWGLFIYSAKTCLLGKTPPRLGHLAPASEVAGGLTLPF